MKIQQNTVSPALMDVLRSLMALDDLSSFRLVGGTCLSLLMGHRISVDIDLFTDAAYGSIDLEKIDQIFMKTFDHVELGFGRNHSMGKSYLIGKSQDEVVKVDLYYTDPFIFPSMELEGIRLAQLEEITAMKLDIIGRNGRKKDFWDLHELLEYFSLQQMLDFYERRYPYNYPREVILNKMIDFKEAEDDFEPICLKSKYWELIKLDIEETVKQESNFLR